MKLDDLVRHLLKSEKGKQLVLGLAHLEDQDSMMYMDVFKQEEGTKQEYNILHFFAQQEILSENHSASERGGKYSVFRITEKGKQYFRELKLRP